MGFLTDFVSGVRRELDANPLDDSTLMARVLSMPPTRDFAGALRAGAPALIAEVKRASPSAGQIADRDPAAQARSYAAGGASAISVLTEPRHFRGSLADLRVVRTAVPNLPLLRKDFLVHPSQVIEARAAGADAVLLITSALGAAELHSMLAAARDLGLGALVETHSDEDLERALATDAEVIGVNARDLETLEVDVDGALARLARVSPGRVTVLESGVSTRRDVERAVRSGASAVLVGEALMRAAEPGAKIRELLGVSA